jgi:hypothetical protein
MSIPTTLFNTVQEVLARSCRQEREIKVTQIRKEEAKLSVCRRDGNSKDSTKENLLELMNEFSKVAGYKTNINPVLFPYTNNK